MFSYLNAVDLRFPFTDVTSCLEYLCEMSYPKVCHKCGEVKRLLIKQTLEAL